MTSDEANALIRDLVFACIRRETLAWALEHAADGRDPVPEAWSLCTDYLMMGCLLPWGHPAFRSCDRCRALNAAFDLVHLLSDENCARCADELRDKVPTLTLTQALATGRARRG